ncbi:PROTEIN MO25 [Salix koriyanagi]|uniref:PROTEIN MO25 n=1 Tax=Salix koriyanagi TaxID=2511006 RepID=A0A9Q1AAE2_9ROSI|nr:PROTEIN MO25 [Salix koriyanagi]
MKRYILEVRYLKVLMTLLEDSSKNIQIAAFNIFKVFVANPSKPREVKMILAKNHEKLLELFHNLSAGKGNNAFELQRSAVVLDTQIGAEDEQFEVEKELIIKEIDKISRRSNLDP